MAVYDPGDLQNIECYVGIANRHTHVGTLSLTCHDRQRGGRFPGELMDPLNQLQAPCKQKGKGDCGTMSAAMARQEE
jgi:hypothetical protein